MTDGLRMPVVAPGVSDLFQALGDPTRLHLMETLARRGRASATVLAQPLAISRQAVDRHLRILAGAGLLGVVKEGRDVLYSVRADRLAPPAEWLADIGRGWERQLDAVKRAAEGA